MALRVGRQSVRCAVGALVSARRRAPPALPRTSRDASSNAGAPAAAAADADAYQVLGVAKDADEDSLKAAFKVLAKRWHPDVHSEATKMEAQARFQEVNEAYQVLSDAAKRKQYDAELAGAKDAEERRKAASRFRATTWNTPVDNVQERIRNAKREEPSTSRGMLAGALVLITGNFYIFFHVLAG